VEQGAAELIFSGDGLINKEGTMLITRSSIFPKGPCVRAKASLLTVSGSLTARYRSCLALVASNLAF
jgi:hypothetical protein